MHRAFITRAVEKSKCLHWPRIRTPELGAVLLSQNMQWSAAIDRLSGSPRSNLPLEVSS